MLLDAKWKYMIYIPGSYKNCSIAGSWEEENVLSSLF
jgi:hypothetical protein